MQRFSFLLVLLGLLTAYSCRLSNDKKAGTHVVAVALKSEPDVLSPLLTAKSQSLQICNLLFLPLLEYHPFTMELRPVLAVSRPKVEAQPDGTAVYYYEIRPEAKWDNGQPVTGYDYEFTYKLMFNPKMEKAAPYKGYFDFVSGIEVDPAEPRKFKVRTKRPYMKSEYVTGALLIYPMYKYDPQGLMKNIPLETLLDPVKSEELGNSNPVLQQFADAFNSPKFTMDSTLVGGCGAYKLSAWKTKEVLKLTRKKDWWGNNLVDDPSDMLVAKPQEIIYRILEDPNTAIALLKTKELGVLTNIPNALFEQLQKDPQINNDYVLHQPTTMQYAYLGLNGKNPKLEDKRVRKALAQLTDVEEIIKVVKKGQAEAIAGPILPTQSYYNKNLALIKLDIEKAKQLISEAGWSDTDGDGIVDKVIQGKKIPLTISLKFATANNSGESIGNILKTNAIKAGVQIELVPTESGQLMEQANARDFEIILLAFNSEPDYDPYQIWHTNSAEPGGSNRFNFGNAESDALIEKLRSTLDEKERTVLYQRFQEMVYDEQPCIFLYLNKVTMAIQKNFTNARTSIRSPYYFENYFDLNTNF